MPKRKDRIPVYLPADLFDCLEAVATEHMRLPSTDCLAEMVVEAFLESTNGKTHIKLPLDFRLN